jgi:hypothetical protein
MTRPFPPAEIVADPSPRFLPAPELERWAREQFINELSPINNPDHEHLQEATLAFLWTNVPNEKHQRRILGTCQMITESGDKWTQGRSLFQLREWFDELPDFLITISAAPGLMHEDAMFMALIEHELYHAGQKKDRYGSPMFSRETGKPLFAMRGHDVEEFVGVVRRYGATSDQLREMARDINRGPTIAEGGIARACGACLRLVKA